jgi:anti-sigma factor ChrR (cupin superfamily)
MNSPPMDPRIPISLTLDPEEIRKRDGFRPLAPGVDVLELFRDGEQGAKAAFLRYAPGGIVAEHQHAGNEYIYVLDGEQEDARGKYPRGTFVVNPPGTSHRVESPGGCLVLVVWERPVQFL